MSLNVINTLTNDGFARVGTAAGTTFNVRLEEQQQKLLCDGYGKLFVIPVGGVPIPGFANEIHYASGGTLITQVLLTPAGVATAAYIIGVTGYNSHPTDTLYVQIHDTSAAAIVLGAVPEIIIPVPGNKIAFSYGLQHLLSDGFLIAISTTELTFTAPAAAYLHTTVRLQTA